VELNLPPGVLLLERGWLSANNVVVCGRDGTAMVDSGYATHAAQTLALVARALGGRSLDLLVNTHLHSDHCGGNAALQARYPLVFTRIPPGEADAVLQWDEARLSYQATGQQCPRFKFDATLAPGRSVRLGDLDWEVHAAPGHDPHAVLLFEPASRVLLSGDALWERGFGIVFPEMWGEPSFDEVADTLDLIESLDPGCVIPGHGRAFGRVQASLATARERLDAFVRAPEKHARHAVKVLIKFKLLDAKRISCSAFEEWIRNVSYVEQVRCRFAADRGLDEWALELLDELVKSGAARIDGGLILDLP